MLMAQSPHGDALLAAGQDEAGADRLDAGLALDQLQSRADGVCGGVGCAAQQAVSLALLDQHGAEVIALGQSGTALLIGHLALAQLDHLGDHLIKALVVGGVDDLGTGDVKAAVSSGLLDGFDLAQQDDLRVLPASRRLAADKIRASVPSVKTMDFGSACSFFSKFSKMDIV